jgi:hypothetical protein
MHESAYGTKRTSNSRLAMSAFGGKADITSRLSDVCFLTHHDISRAEFAVLHNTGPHMHPLRHSAVVTALAER